MVLLAEPIHDFVVARGDRLQILVIWNGAPNGQAVDLTDFDSQLVIRDDAGAELLTLGSDRIALGADGSVVVTLTGDETLALVPGVVTPGAPPVRCHYQLRVVEAGGDPATILKGVIVVTYSAIES